MTVRFIILSLMVGYAFAPTVIVTNLVTRLPLPGGGFLTNVARVRIKPQSQVASVTVDTNGVPAAPSDVIATPIKDVLLRWGYPPADTNVTFWVYKSVDLTNWFAFTSHDYNVRAVVLPNLGDALGFYSVAASNDAGQVFAPKVIR